MTDLWMENEVILQTANPTWLLISFYWTKVPKQNDILHLDGNLSQQTRQMQSFARGLQTHYGGSMMMVIMMHVLVVQPVLSPVARQ